MFTLYIYRVFNDFQTFYYLMHLVKLLLYNIDPNRDRANLLLNRSYYFVEYYLIEILTIYEF